MTTLDAIRTNVTTAEAIAANEVLLRHALRQLSELEDQLRQLNAEGTERMALLTAISRPVMKNKMTAATMAQAAAGLETTKRHTELIMSQVESLKATIVVLTHRIEQLREIEV